MKSTFRRFEYRLTEDRKGILQSVWKIIALENSVVKFGVSQQICIYFAHLHLF